jgi:hypothetical protein
MTMKSVLVALALAVALVGCSGDAADEAAPTTSTDDVAGLVTDFMKARQAGLPADEFLVDSALAAYEGHDAGLWLYDDSLPGGPGGQFDRFSVEGAEGSSQSVVVRIHVVWNGDAEPGDMVEALTVESGKIVEVRRTDGPGRDGLPFEVAMKREDIYRAAVAHDYEALRLLVDHEEFSYSFGKGGDPIGYWRRQEKSEIPILGDILSGVIHTRFGVNEGIYVWPSAAAKLPSDWIEADVQAMHQAGYTDDDIDSFKQFGGYTGWRVGIRADGTWLYFISGD